MNRLIDEGIVETDSLIFDEIFTGRTLTAVIISGRVVCRDGLCVQVNKRLDVRAATGGGYDVKGAHYDYHAWLSAADQPVLRYDNSHEWLGLHVHVFDPGTGKELTEQIELENLPTLDRFIRLAIERAKRFVQA